MQTKRTLQALLLLISVLLGAAGAARAQGPFVDPRFVPGQVYEPGPGRQIVEQADGKRVLLGRFARVAGQPAQNLARLLPGSNQLDQAFQANTSGLQGAVELLLPLPGGKLLLLSNGSAPIGSGTLTLGPVTRQRLLRLNADGSPDSTFRATFLPLSPGAILDMVAQPDGKVVITGSFTHINGQMASNLARLNVDGSLDTAFQGNFGAGLDNTGMRLALQPDGAILVSGPFTTVAGAAQRGLARLQANGQFDVGFRPALPAAVYAECLVVQPDGAVLIAEVLAASQPTVRRFLPSGAVDNTFQVGSWSGGFHRNQSPVRSGNTGLAVQPDGRIVVATHARTYNGLPVGRLVRLLPSGALDASFVNPRPSQALLYEDDYMPQWLQVLPSGQLLLAGSATPAGTAAALDNFCLLDANGSRSNAFIPAAYALGRVNDVVLQADGTYLVGGSFTEINGAPAGNLARLRADGTVEAAFTSAAAADREVQKLLLQPDGKVLVGGQFGVIGGLNRVAVARLLPTGAADAAFAPVSRQLVYSRATVPRIALQADGSVLIHGNFNHSSDPNYTPYSGGLLRRLNGSTGAVDSSFMPSDNLVQGTWDMLSQPDGKLLLVGTNLVPRVGGGAGPVVVWRMLPNGTPDPSFQLSETFGSPSTSMDVGTALALDQAGNIYVGGIFRRAGNLTGPFSLLRLFPSGQIDQTFSAPVTGNFIYALAVQPDGRVVVGGHLILPGFSNPQGLMRLLPNGSLDPSFSPAAGPALEVSRLLAQADGAVVAAGSFASVGGLRINALVRLVDTAPLSVQPGAAAAQLQVWPLPAHEELRISLLQGQPRQVELLDAQGRVVRQQAVSQAESLVPLTGLAPGLYCLRVHLTTGGSVSRRIMVE